MKTRKTPMRKCTGCQQVREKRDLIRVVRSPQGDVSLERSGKVAGRGAYLCDDPACLEKAIKTKALARALEADIAPELYDILRKEMAAHE